MPTRNSLTYAAAIVGCLTRSLKPLALTDSTKFDA
jgi:hypothetical protein